MQRILQRENKFGEAANGYIQKSERMGALIVAGVKSILGNIIALLLWAGYLSTGIDWFKTLGIISLLVTIGYNGHKWIKEIHADFRTGKKKLPFKKRTPK